jgi:outer membrane protein assembly factor BamD (BamD/ComL family)
MRGLSLAALALVALPLQAQQSPTATSTTRMTLADTSLTPPIDPARSLEAEVRVALNDLLANRTVSALQRLQWLASLPATPSPAGASTETLRGRGDMLFLLAQAQYRLGMDSAFRSNAQAVLSSGPARYAPLLNSQLLLSAYRTGDFARVSSLVQGGSPGQSRGLAALVAGLAAYQLRNYPSAATNFAAAKAAGAPYALYAEYMDVLTSLRTDTTQTTPALARLEALAQTANGTFADQVRITAAQLAYETNAYDRAISFANAVTPNGGLAPLALLTKAWAQYKNKDVAGAGQSFAAFADQYPLLPQRDEARLMAAQSLLQLGQTDQAGRLFRMVSDSGRAESSRLDNKSTDAVMNLARSLVKARAAGLLFANDPAMGKTIALEETAGADPQVLASVMTGTTPSLPQVEVARIVSLNDLMQRYGPVGDSAGMTLSKRVLFAPASANAAPTLFAQRAEAVMAADLDAAITSQRLRLASRNATLRLMQIRGLQQAMQGRGDTVAKLVARVDTTDARLRGLLTSIDSTESHLRGSLVTQVRNVQGGPAYVLSVRADSLRQRGLIPPGLDVEALVAARTDSLLNALPLFLLRDSVRIRLTKVRQELAESKTSIEQADRLFAAAQTGQLTDTSVSLTRLRSAQAAAQSRRSEAEAGLVAAVSTELSARATDLLALLQHDLQAAEFGSATAAFFNAIDQGRPAGAGTTTGTSGTGSSASLTGPSGANGGSTTRSTTNAQSGAAASKGTPPARTGTPPTQKK